MSAICYHTGKTLDRHDPVIFTALACETYFLCDSKAAAQQYINKNLSKDGKWIKALEPNNKATIDISF